MGREVRRVPANWQHPKNERGQYVPLLDEDYGTAARQWLDDAIAWDNGTHADAAAHKAEYPFFWQWESDPPDSESYRPAYVGEPTHYQMYETTSEGTPISPVMETPEELARWLADTNASAFGDQGATYEGWLRVCRGGFAPSAVARGGRMQSGVDALTDDAITGAVTE